MKNMFYNEEMMKIKSLKKVWRAANYQTDSESDEISLPKICEELDEWVGSEVDDAHRRLSLRTSAVFIHGAAEVYKKKMQQLLKDVDKINQEMIFRKRRISNSEVRTGTSETSTESSRTPDSPEQILQISAKSPNISSITMGKRKKESQLNIVPMQHSFSSCTESTSSINQTSETSSDDTLNRIIIAEMSSNGSADLNKSSQLQKSECRSLLRRIHEDGSMQRRTSNQSLQRRTLDVESLQRQTQDKTTRDFRSLERRTSEGGSVPRRTTDGGSLQRRTSKGGSLPKRTSEHAPSQRRTHSNADTHSRISRGHTESSPQIIGVPEQDQRKDQAAQTSLSYLSGLSEEDRNLSDGEGFDETLPFGCVLIYNNYNSRIPSQIVFSSVNLG